MPVSEDRLAGVAELVDAPGLGPGGHARGGSSPLARTTATRIGHGGALNSTVEPQEGNVVKVTYTQSLAIKLEKLAK